MHKTSKIDKVIDLLDDLAYIERIKYVKTGDKMHYWRMNMCKEILFRVDKMLKECDK